MAECYRKSIRKHVVLNCHISREADEYLRQFKGAMAYGWAIDELVKQQKSSTTSSNSDRTPHKISAYG